MMHFLQRRDWPRLLVGMLFVSLLSVGVPAPVHAQDAIVLAGYCEFDVQLDILTYKAVEHVILDEISLITGSVKVRLTNLESGSSLDLNIPGPGTISSNTDGETTIHVMNGPWLVGVPVGVLPDYPYRLFLSRGHVVGTQNSASEWTSLSIPNNATDLCAALAD